MWRDRERLCVSYILWDRQRYFVRSNLDQLLERESQREIEGRGEQREFYLPTPPLWFLV